MSEVIPNSNLQTPIRQTTRAFQICRNSQTTDTKELAKQTSMVIRSIALSHGINMGMTAAHAQHSRPRQEEDAIAVVTILNDRDPPPILFTRAMINHCLFAVTHGAQAREEEEESFSYTLLRAMDVHGKPWMKAVLFDAVNQPRLNDHVGHSWPSCVSFLVKGNPYRPGVSGDFSAALSAGLKHFTAG